MNSLVPITMSILLATKLQFGCAHRSEDRVGELVQCNGVLRRWWFSMARQTPICLSGYNTLEIPPDDLQYLRPTNTCRGNPKSSIAIFASGSRCTWRDATSRAWNGAGQPTRTCCAFTLVVARVLSHPSGRTAPSC